MKKSKFDILFEEIMDCLTKQSSVVLPDETVTCELCGKNITRKVVWDKHAGNQYQSEAADFSCEDPDFQHEHICLDCAEKQAQKYQEQFVNGTDKQEHILEFINNDDGEPWVACASCGQLYPETELRNTDSGNVCNNCIDGWVSHGEHFSVNY